MLDRAGGIRSRLLVPGTILLNPAAAAVWGNDVRTDIGSLAAIVSLLFSTTYRPSSHSYFSYPSSLLPPLSPPLHPPLPIPPPLLQSPVLTDFARMVSHARTRSRLLGQLSSLPCIPSFFSFFFLFFFFSFFFRVP